MPPQPGRFRRFLAALRREPRSYPQVWYWAVGTGLAMALGVMIGGHAVNIGLAVGAASVTVCAGAFGSYRLSRWRAAVAAWEASRLRNQRPQQ